MPEEPQGQQGPQAIKFDDFIKSQPDNVRTAFDEHTKGLKSALDSEREARKNFEAQLKTQIATIEGEGKKKLESLLAERDEANAAASFYETAIAEGVNNPKLAFIAAKNDGMIKNGNVDWKRLKADYIQLFTKPGTPPPPGAGAGGGPGKSASINDIMNQRIRGNG